MPPPLPRLSKSRFTSGLQCHKKLWWTVHEPDAKELQPDTVLQDLFDQARQVGEAARIGSRQPCRRSMPAPRRSSRLQATATASYD